MTTRQRKTDRGVTDYVALIKAIKLVKCEGFSKIAAAEQHKIPKSSFYRYIDKLDEQIPDITKVDDNLLLKAVKKIASYSTPTKVCIYQFNSVKRVVG